MVFSARISEKEARIRNYSGKFHTLDRNTRGLSRKSIDRSKRGRINLEPVRGVCLL